MKKIKSPIKSGNYNLNEWVIQNFPDNYENMIYCEPYCGSAQILLNKSISKEEVISDINECVTNIFKSLRDEPIEFITKVKKIKYTEKSFKEAKNCDSNDYIDKAVSDYILHRMSHRGLKQKFIHPVNGKSQSWDNMLCDLEKVADRLKNVIILNINAIDVIKAWQEENCFMYIDPPEINDDSNMIEDQISLLQTIKGSKSKIIISSYYSSFYKNHLPGWKCIKRKNESSTKTECLWKNF